MSFPSSSNHEGNDAWLMKIELKREEPGEINKDDGIKKAMGDQVPAVAEEDILQPHHNLFTLTVEDITTEGKPPRRGRFTFSYTEAQGNPEDGALRMKLRGPEPAGGLGPMIVNRHDCINLHCKIRKKRPRQTLV